MTAAIDAAAGLFTPEGLADPYPVYARLRAESPVHRSEVLGGWLLTRYADTQQVLADGERFRVMDADWRDVNDPGWRERDAMLLLTELLPWKNPPKHTRDRALLTRDFTMRRIRALEPAVRRLVDAVLDRFADATADGGNAEFVSTVLYPVSMTVIGDLVGVPAEDHQKLRWGTEMLIKQLDPSTPQDLYAEIDEATKFFRDYFADLLVARRAEPRDDLASALAARVGADVDPVSEEEVLDALLVLFVGGYETTAGALGNGIRALLTHPQEHARLIADPGLVGSAVEEMLRWDGMSQFAPRHTVAPVQIGDVEIATGDLVYACMGAANRDPDRFTNPDTFSITRDEGRGLYFGHGLHMCLGASLARLEITVLIEELVRRFPKLAIAGEVVRRPNVAVRGLASLPLTR